MTVPGQIFGFAISLLLTAIIAPVTGLLAPN